MQRTTNAHIENTFGLPVEAPELWRLEFDADLPSAIAELQKRNLKWLIVGDASNLLLPPELTHVVLQDTREFIEREDNCIQASSGCPWDALVEEAVSAGLYGIENLSGIPGRVGAAPIQNIGAYGAQLSDCLESVVIFDAQSMAYEEWPAEALRLGYRDSIFKAKEGAHYIVVDVKLRLKQDFTPNLDYPGLNELLGDARRENRSVSALDVRHAVLRLRQKKIPNPRARGNVGSFFKNPIINRAQREACEVRGLTIYQTEQGDKASAAQMIEFSKLKGMRFGGAMVSLQHALIIENVDGATYNDVLQLKREVQLRVEDVFSVQLEVEPQIIPERLS